MANEPRDRALAFLREHRVAVVGASRDERSFSRAVLRELLRAGYDAVPVNPSAYNVEGRRCFASVCAIDPPATAAILMTPPERTAEAVRACADAGIRHVWLHRGHGGGSASPAALATCAAHGIEPVTDLCPMMVLPRTGWVHRAHGFIRQLALH